MKATLCLPNEMDEEKGAGTAEDGSLEFRVRAEEEWSGSFLGEMGS